MNFELTKPFLDELKLNLNKKNDKQVLKICDRLLAPDVAEILKILNFKESKYLLSILNDEFSADVLVEVEEDIREKLLNDLSTDEIVEDVLENLDSDDAADVIQELPDKVQKEVISKISHATDVVDLLSYEDSSAGALMAKELIKVKEEWNVVRCVSEMRIQAKKVENVYTIYVVNDKNQLTGTVSLKKLLLSEKRSQINKIFDNHVISVKSETSDEEVARIMNKYNLVVLPVVNNRNELIGRITIDDVLDYVKEEAEKDYQLASGISESIEPNDSIINLTKARIPWLIIGMIGGLIGAQIIGLFPIKENPILAFFIPLIIAMGGNVGVQSSAIVVQAIASKNLGVQHWTKRLAKEVGVALLNGIICSSIVLIVCFLLYSQIKIGIIVSVSLVTVMLFASLFGTFVPIILNNRRVDPALATGPFITTMNDVIGLFIYFSIAEFII